ncbi:MAG: DUF2750 domain-containing protein [Planctomycetaceae bacterium]|nr:DUF2750 domain-containing protein [Planctomycetaceae bacterium]
MLRDVAQSQDNHRRFIERVIAAETVWYLDSGNGAAYCESNEDEEGRPVLMFWSDRAYAERVRRAEFDDCSVDSISLFDFLFRWLAGMAQDNVLVGANWTGDLVGLESDPQAVRDEILDALSAEKTDQYKQQLANGIEEQNRRAP